MSWAKAREEEYLRRMRERGYEPSLAGMDDEDIEWELARMDRGPQRPQAPALGQTYRPPDRDFAERMFKMFSRPFDPKWEMPNLDGPEYRQNSWVDPRDSRRRPGGQVWNAGDFAGAEWGGYDKAPAEKAAGYEPGWGNTAAGIQPMSWSIGRGGEGGRDENWSIDPFGIYPSGGSSSAGDSAGKGTLDRYRSSEIGPIAGSPGYIDAGASRNNEARAGTADDFTFTSDPLKEMSVRRGAKSNTYGVVRKNSDGTPRPHQGVDLSAKKETDAIAVEDGRVIDVDNDEGGYGHYVKMEFEKNGKKYYAFYAHLNGPPPVKVGEAVRAGQVVGQTGTSGNATGMQEEDHHLHFEVHTRPDFVPGMEGRRDPMKHFRAKMEVNNDL